MVSLFPFPSQLYLSRIQYCNHSFAVARDAQAQGHVVAVQGLWHLPQMKHRGETSLETNGYAFFAFLTPLPGFSSFPSMSMNFLKRLCLVSDFFALISPYAIT